MRVNSELRKSLKKAAIDADVTMEELLHLILCRALHREDLILQAPELA